jgi:hypothetical protein
MSLAGLGRERDRVGEAQQRLLTTDPLSRQRAQQSTATNPHLSGSNRNMVMGLKWMSDTNTDWPTDNRS